MNADINCKFLCMGKLLCFKCAIVWLNNKICLKNRKNHLSPSTRRSPGSESSRKVCAAYFLCHCCQMKWFFRTCGESLPISFHSSIPLLELTLVLQITESKDSSIIFMKIGRRSKPRDPTPLPLIFPCGGGLVKSLQNLTVTKNTSY